MRCEEARFRFEEAAAEGLSEAVRDHLAQCADCRAYAREWRLARAGFLALAEEAVPEASLGFATRLLRRLEERRQPAEFLERAGRRVVYAGVLLALMLLLGLALPASGPLGGQAPAEFSLAQSEMMAAESDPVGVDLPPDFRDYSPAKPAPEATKGQE